MGGPARNWIDYSAFVDLERDAVEKHEWFDGQVFAMAGGTFEHGALTANVIAELATLARACGCRVFSSDVLVRVLTTGLATYPDASVVCGPVESDPANRNAMTNPSVLVEVLSDSTEAYDRGDKFEHCRAIASLRDYVLVSQHRRRIEVFSRGADGRWTLASAASGGRVELTALGASLEVDRVFEGVELSEATRPAVG